MVRTLKNWQLIYTSIDAGIPVMLLYVLQSEGSSPGRQGFFMAVNARGEMEGSIGGGIMEHKFVEEARAKLRDLNVEVHASSIKKQIHDKSAKKDQSGMICSGEQTILLYQLKDDDKKTVEKIITTLEDNRNGSLRLNPSGIHFSDTVPEWKHRFELRSNEDWEYEELLGYKHKLTIIGGGHCALAFSRLMSTMDFYVRVYDDRPQLKTMLENHSAHEKILVKDYAELANLVNPGENHYVVIMTFGYRTDDQALRALLGKEFAYLGLLGSKKKIEKMFDDYVKEGISASYLQRIHTPIGLDIKSQTPEEIAVSIAAEIIREKNKDL